MTTPKPKKRRGRPKSASPAVLTGRQTGIRIPFDLADWIDAHAETLTARSQEEAKAQVARFIRRIRRAKDAEHAAELMKELKVLRRKTTADVTRTDVVLTALEEYREREEQKPNE